MQVDDRRTMTEIESNEPPDSYMVRVALPMAPVWAAWVLLGINIVMFLLTHALSWWLAGHPVCVLQRLLPYNCALQILGWKQNDLIYQGEYWRLVSAMFLHGNIIHIGFNGFALVVLGPEMERIYGTARFLTIYFLAGLAGSIASYAFSSSPSVGASGAIFGLIGGLAAFYYLGREILGDTGRQQLQSIGIVIALNLVIGLSSGGIIDNYAHIGGLIGGAITGWVLAPRYSIETDNYSPILVRRYSQLNWMGAIGMFFLLLIIFLLINHVLPPV